MDRQRMDGHLVDRDHVGRNDVGEERMERTTVDGRGLGRSPVDQQCVGGWSLAMNVKHFEAVLRRSVPRGETVMSTQLVRHSFVRVGAVVVAVVAMLSASLVSRAPVPAGARQTYIVRALSGRVAAATEQLRALGADVTRELVGIDEAVVRMDPVTAGQARALRDVVAITADTRVELASDSYSTDTSYDPTADPYSLFNAENVIRATDLWRWNSGKRVDVALLDSGVSPVPGLDGPNKIVYGPDLSFDSQDASLQNGDGYGHGTHMAGIIAGHDAGAYVSPYAAAQGAFLGVAPNARIVSVKLADAYGATDVSQVIAGIDWVVQHAHDNGMNIRVINLSFGTSSMQDAAIDPLAYAAEAAWQSGIVVVVSAGNSGTTMGRLADPAIDPWVIAVGADDTNGTRSTSDDVVPDYSSRGDGDRNPDFVAPGAHLQSLRVPGSQIDDQYGSGPGSINDRYLRGSGTSQAAAVTSGAVALLLSVRPSLSPDAVKALLVASAQPMPSPPDPYASGAGLLNIRAAALMSVPSNLQSPAVATGGGLLDASRGGQQLSLNGTSLTGETDIFGNPFDATAHAADEANGAAWDGGTWNGATWSGPDWSGTSWQSANWTSPSWAGTAWTSSTTNDASWDGRRWANATWEGRRWADSQWSTSNFETGDWAVGSWN
jgi:serine protease AprX